MTTGRNNIDAMYDADVPRYGETNLKSWSRFCDELQAWSQPCTIDLVEDSDRFWDTVNNINQNSSAMTEAGQHGGKYWFGMASATALEPAGFVDPDWWEGTVLSYYIEIRQYLTNPDATSASETNLAQFMIICRAVANDGGQNPDGSVSIAKESADEIPWSREIIGFVHVPDMDWPDYMNKMQASYFAYSNEDGNTEWQNDAFWVQAQKQKAEDVGLGFLFQDHESHKADAKKQRAKKNRMSSAQDTHELHQQQKDDDIDLEGFTVTQV